MVIRISAHGKAPFIRIQETQMKIEIVCNIPDQYSHQFSKPVVTCIPVLLYNTALFRVSVYCRP